MPVTSIPFGQVRVNLRASFDCLGMEARLVDCPRSYYLGRCYTYYTGVRCLEQTGWCSRSWCTSVQKLVVYNQCMYEGQKLVVYNQCMYEGQKLVVTSVCMRDRSWW